MIYQDPTGKKIDLLDINPVANRTISILNRAGKHFHYISQIFDYQNIKKYVQPPQNPVQRFLTSRLVNPIAFSNFASPLLKSFKHQ